MARTRTNEPETPTPDAATPNGHRSRRAIRAAAYRIDLQNKRVARTQKARHQEWQDEAWANFDDLGIIKYAMWFAGNAMAGLRIFAAVRPVDDPEGQPIPVTDPESGIPTSIAQRARSEIERIRGPLGGQAEILRVWNMNLEIAGECHLVGIGPTITETRDPLTDQVVQTITPERWNVASVRELDVIGDGEYKLREEPGGPQSTLDAEKDIVVRSYLRHPAWAKLADSNMRGVLSDCEALILLTNQVKAIAKSHQNGGLLLMPNGLSVSGVGTAATDADDAGSEDADDDDDLFDQALQDAMLDPIEDPSSPYSVYPVVVRGEKEDLKEVRHISLARDMTADQLEGAINGRKQAIAEGLNIPVETALGHQQTTFSNAFQVDQDLFDDHLKPRCELICDAWTVGLLQPALIEAGIPDEITDRIFVWYDPADIIGRVDPIDSADVGHEKGLLGGEAWRRVKGWSEDDAPTPEEVLLNSILRQRQWDPAIVDSIIGAIDPGVGLEPGSIPETAPVNLAAALLHVLTDARKANTLAGTIVASAARKAIAKDPGRRLAEIDRDLRTKLIVAADRAMLRALERAGIRLKTKTEQTKAVLRTVHPVYAGQHLGPAFVAAAGINEADLIDPDAFDALGLQFEQWIEHAQRQALDVVASAVMLAAGQRSALATRQAEDRAHAWTWMRDELHKVALVRLYKPDPDAPPSGEFDPNVKVPAGLVRQAIARAGGATAIEPVRRGTVRAALVAFDPYVALNNDGPLGGIGTGELISGAMEDAGALVEGWEWDYGPAFRLHPFEDHESLDGEVFESFDSDVLAGGLDGNNYPGDHDGCLCDVIPSWVLPEDVASSEASAVGEDNLPSLLPSGSSAVDDGTDLGTALDSREDDQTVRPVGLPTKRG